MKNKKKESNKADCERKQKIRKNRSEEIDTSFEEVIGVSKVDPSITKSEAFSIVKKKFEISIQKGPTFICNICFKFEYRRNVIYYNEERYGQFPDVFEKCKTDKISLDNNQYICHSCDKSLQKGKMPAQAQNNNLNLNERFFFAEIRHKIVIAKLI